MDQTEETRRSVNLKELLDENALRLTLDDGHEYVIRDMPLALMMEIGAGKEMKPLEYLRKVLIPHGVPEELLSEAKLGVRSVQVLYGVLLDFFTAAEVLDKAGISPAVQMAFRTMSQPLETSSLSIPDTD